MGRDAMVTTQSTTQGMSCGLKLQTELSGRDIGDDEDASEASGATLFFFIF